jgi:hypothetical protein
LVGALVAQDLEGDRNTRLVGSSELEVLILGPKKLVGGDGWCDSLDESPAQPLVALLDDLAVTRLS